MMWLRPKSEIIDHPPSRAASARSTPLYTRCAQRAAGKEKAPPITGDFSTSRERGFGLAFVSRGLLTSALCHRWCRSGAGPRAGTLGPSDEILFGQKCASLSTRPSFTFPCRWRKSNQKVHIRCVSSCAHLRLIFRSFNALHEYSYFVAQ